MPGRPNGVVRRLAVAVVALGVSACSTGPGSGSETATAPTTTTEPPRRATTSATTTVPPTTLPPTTTVPPTTVPPTTLPPTTLPPAPPALELGAEGPEVLALQQTLAGLGFWLGQPDGHYQGLTQQAVMAFQKANGLGRDGVAGPMTMAAIAAAARPVPRVVSDGIEIDLERQLLLVVQGGSVVHALNTSTGRSGWRTPPGDFAIYNEIDGMRHAPLGDLWRPKYFRGGIAMHGASSIPAQPASHGCARLSNAAIDMLWASGLAGLGTRVVVY
jgi:peptidoglycan hydrolase-like protein with peptidoglycan-binding domain